MQLWRCLGDAIRNEEWIAVTGWTPHWMFARWDLKYLEDPEGVFGEAEEIHTLTRVGLKEDMPEVYAFLDNFQWPLEKCKRLWFGTLKKEQTLSKCSKIHRRK